MNNKVVGDVGESKAVLFLKKKKYKILETNFRQKFGEIDVVAKQKNTIVFVEVKARTSAKFGLPREAVGVYKQNKIRLVASAYLQKKKLFDVAVRFDVLEILGEDVTHIENCF